MRVSPNRLLNLPIRSIARWLPLVPRNIVWVDGGLGTQFLGIMSHRIRQEWDPATQCDVSYFFPVIDKPIETAGATRRPWELHRYGIPLDSPDFIHSRWHGVPRNLKLEHAVNMRVVPVMAQRDWSDLFPVAPETDVLLESLGLQRSDDYAAVHVRRGDYLRVASRVVELSESLELCVRVQRALPKHVVFLSDDAFTKEEQNEIAHALPEKTCLFVSGGDQHASHGLLRNADVLVTSNSTFSFTAALLAEHHDSLKIAPQNFFGNDLPLLNRSFQSASNWMVVK